MLKKLDTGISQQTSRNQSIGKTWEKSGMTGIKLKNLKKISLWGKIQKDWNITISLEIFNKGIKVFFSVNGLD